MDKCYSLIERQMYSEAFRLLNSILKNEFDQPKLETIFLLQYLLNQTSRYRNIQIKLLELVTPEENEEEKYFSLIFDLICIYIDQMNFQQAEFKMNQLKKYLQSIKNNKIFLYYLDGIKNMIQHKQKNIDPKEQYEEYERLLKKEQQSKYFEQDGMPAYLIPSRWIKKWKSYVTNLPIQAENDTIIIEKEVENLRIMLNVSCDIDIEEQINNPGPINGLTLIQIYQSLEVDPLSSKQYQNYVLRENLREGSDFILVGYELFDYFKKIYGGFEIKRLIVEHQQTHQKYVDLAPRLFGFLIIPAESNPQIRHITANASDQIQDIQKKVKRIFNIQNEIRFWKFNDASSQENFVQKFYKQELYKQIAGKVINKTTVLEEINFATNDFFICEIKQGKDWYMSEINQKQASQLKSKMNVSEVPVMDEDSRKGLTGLQNLGNTCFMNAALQCLSNTYELTEYMVSNEFSQHLNCNNPLGTKGLMATAYAELMKSMWYGSDQSVSAYDLKRVIGKFAPQFYGYGQQDSHEFLSYLLDGLHEDLNKVLTKPLVKDIEITNESDFEASRIFWNNYVLRNQSKIQELMVGQYKSTLVCPNCKRISKTFDPYMSLSLPIPSYSFLQFHFYVIYNTGKQADKVSISVTSDQDFKSIINDISKSINLDPEYMNFVLIKDHTIKERITLKKNVKQCAEHEGQLFVFQVDKEYYSLQDNQIHIDFYYCTKSDRMYANESVFTFPRQLVIEKTYKPIEVYFKIYQQFKYHFKNIISKVATKFFHEGTNIEEIEQNIPQNLEEYITEMKNYKEVPFQLTYRGKLLQFDSELTIDTFNQKTLSINVILNPQISKDEIVALKFQRCKDVMIEQSRQVKNGEYTLEDCLRTFAKEEILGKGDEWYCNRCKLHVQATKQMEIYRAPKVLVIHLKRFRSANRISNYGNFFYTGGSQKITNLVHFPKSLNLNNYVLSKLNDNDCIDYTYDLYGVDNHYGGLGGGHYTASAYNSVINKWVDYDDSRARVTNQNIESEAAYVLFYRRKDSQKCILGK